MQEPPGGSGRGKRPGGGAVRIPLDPGPNTTAREVDARGKESLHEKPFLRPLWAFEGREPGLDAVPQGAPDPHDRHPDGDFLRPALLGDLPRRAPLEVELAD